LLPKTPKPHLAPRLIFNEVIPLSTLLLGCHSGLRPETILSCYSSET